MWKRISTAHEWDNALLRLHQPHVLQSWAWGQQKSRWGWQPQRWAFFSADGSAPQAAVQLLRKPLGPFCALYAPRGPVLGTAQSQHACLDFLQQQAKQQRAIWLKIDGDLGGLVPLADLRQTLRQRDWHYSSDQVQIRNTGISLIPKTDEDLLAAMKQKTRYNVRLAAKHGVTIRPATPADDDLLYALYTETAQRDGFIIREQAYYVDAWRTMCGQGFVAEHNGVPLAGLVLFAFANRAYYLYGMSKTDGREHMPTYALQFAAMQWARANDCEIYDWWGAPENPSDENDGMAGVWKFKLGFGAQFAEGLGAWDFVPSPLLHKTYTQLLRFIKRT